MKFITAAEMKGTDQVTVEQYGGSWAALMEQAGAAVARFVQLQWPRAKRIALICGKGNNGGDGFVAARLLAEAGLEVTVVLLGDPAKLKGDAANNFRKLSMKPLLITDAPGLARSEVGAKLAAADVIVDAI